MFKVNNRNTSCSSVSIVNFEQVNAGWDDADLCSDYKFKLCIVDLTYYFNIIWQS